MELANISNPSRDGSCQFFDTSQLTSAIEFTTNLSSMVTQVSGTHLCEVTFCNPSPCHHGGICTERDDVVHHYECTLCGQGYSGVNCSEDINECDQGNTAFELI